MTAVTVGFVGDLILGAPEAGRYFDFARDALRSYDVAVAHVEWPHTRRGAYCGVEYPAPAAPPENLAALVDCGFGVATLASNHTFDQGPNGVEDTVAELHRLGIATTGAGMTLQEARRPAVLTQGGLRLGFLGYNAVGPKESWATPLKAGAAWVNVMSHYELEMASPGSRPTEYTFVEQSSLEGMQADVSELASRVDVVSVSFHKGMGFVHAELAQYERALSRAAIDAGAHVVIGHHAHILRGVETYRGRPIFHGINHFVTAYEPRSNPRSESTNRPSFGHRNPVMREIRPDPSVKNWPYPADSRNTMIARVTVDETGVLAAGFQPAYTDAEARPHVVGDDELGRSVADYVAHITEDAGIQATFKWEGDWVRFE
jgi:poly-gamma-glutamate capsule biosynthesis protein CapA/YwtB (metallophosphatase superfamily)